MRRLKIGKMRFGQIKALLPASLGIALAIFVAGCSKEAKKAKALEAAEHDFASQNYDRAEVEYLTALRVPPPSPRALLQLGRIYFEQGRFPQAYVYFRKGLELEPGDTAARALMAKALAAAGDLNEARKQALLALDKNAGEEEALFALVESTVSTNQVLETLRRMETVPTAERGRVGYKVARGAMYLRQGDLNQAEAEFKGAVAVDGNSSQAYLAIGTLYLARTNVAEAEKAFQKAAELSPVRSAARLMYADFKLKRGDKEAARTIAQEMTAKAPDYVPALNFLAQMEFADGKRDECKKILDRVITRDPANLEALTLKGTQFLAEGNTTNAIAQFERILSTYGKLPGVQYKLAQARLQAGETAKARSLLEEIVRSAPGFVDAALLRANLQIRAGNARAAIESASKLVKEHPEILEANMLLAEAYLSRKDFGKATEVYEEMMGRFPARPDVPLVLGALYAQQGRKTDARKAFEKALEIKSDYLPAQEKVLELDLMEQRFGSALARVQQEIGRKPDAPEPWIFAAKVHMAQALAKAGITNADVSRAEVASRLSENAAAAEKVKEAETALRKAMDLNPKLRTPYLLMSQLYVRTGREREALERLSVLTKTNDVEALMEVGLVQTELKNYVAAREAYEQALKVNRNLAPVWNNLAFLYCEHLGKLDKAYEAAMKARELLPRDPRTADTLGWVNYKRGEFQKAAELCQESARGMSTDAEVQYHLGMAHYMLGEEEAARGALSRALALDSHGLSERVPDWRVEAEKRLAVLNMDVGKTEAGKLADLERTLSHEKGDPVALARLAEVEERQGNFAQAAGHCEELLRKESKNSRVQYRLARLYAGPLKGGAGNSERALELAKKAHASEPENAGVSYLLGRLVYENGDYTWALSLVQEAGRKLPGGGGAERYYYEGMAQYRLKNRQESVEALSKALSEGLQGEHKEQAMKVMGELEKPSMKGQASDRAGG